MPVQPKEASPSPKKIRKRGVLMGARQSSSKPHTASAPAEHDAVSQGGKTPSVTAESSSVVEPTIGDGPSPAVHPQQQSGVALRTVRLHCTEKPTHPVVTPAFASHLAEHLPQMEFRKEWCLLYNSEVHGKSFTRLCERITSQGPTLLVVRDGTGGLFGGFCCDSWQSVAEREQAAKFNCAARSSLSKNWANH